MTEETSSVHEKLQLSTHIRLVELLPSANIDDDIRCRVRIVNLDDVPRYEAVSYVWGSESDKAEILCDGLTLQIPRNLTAAFRRFRQSTIPRLLWADSICINQANISEKNHQVRIMGRIYAGATTVLIWLGEAEEEYLKLVVQGLDTLIELANSGRLDEINQDVLATMPRDEDGDSIYDLIDILFNVSTGSLNEMKAVMRLFTKGWFKRAWTFQESFLANDRRVFLGSLEIAVDDLQFALYALHKLHGFNTPEASRALVHNGKDILQSLLMLMPKDDLTHPTLQTLMDSRRGCECKHAVDLVYSLLELTEDTMSIVPDYHKFFPQVFAEAMMVMIRADESLATLGMVDIVPRSTISELPSWLPDWRIPVKQYGILSLGSKLFSCAGTTKPRVSISSNSRNLTTSGFVIDSIEELLLPRVALNRLEAQEDMGAAWIRLLCCDLDMFIGDMSNVGTKRWDRSTYDMYNTIVTHLLQSNGMTAESSALMDRIFSRYKRVMTTRCERKGVAPTNAEAGDFVTVLFGGHVPVLLRPTAIKNEFLFVGECYVDQMMDGEAMEQLANVQNRAARSRTTRFLERCSGIVANLARTENSNLQLYQIRDFVLV